MAKKNDKTSLTNKPKRRTVFVSPAQDVPVFYTNSANTELSNFDVRIRFGQIEGVEDDAVHIKETFRVFMSHQHFRAFAKAVNSTLQKLDEQAEPNEADEKETAH